MCVSAAAFTAFGLVMMQCAARGEASYTWGLSVSLVCFVVCVLLVVTGEVRRVARRFEDPEREVWLALRRIRSGDVAFRVSRRRGDPLAGVVRECNELIEWLNVQAPAGMLTGGDIVDVEMELDDEERAW